MCGSTGAAATVRCSWTPLACAVPTNKPCTATKTPVPACRRSSHNALQLDIPVEASINQEAVALYREREAKRQKLKEEQVGGFAWSLQ